MSGCIYKCLWMFLKIMTAFYDLLQSGIRKLKAFYLKSYDLATGNSHCSYEMAYLELCKANLQKIPKHLSIVIGHDDEIGLEMLSKVVVYALILGIDYISFYDTRGRFSLEKMQVPKFISSKKMQNGHFLLSMPGDKSKSAQLTYKNGLEKTIEVVVLSSKDGKPLIAEICRELFEERNTKEVQDALKERTSLTSKITQALQRKLNYLPDPECAIIFSRHMCTYGLLPWHTGFTEFHLIKTGSYFNVRAFAKVLYKFAKVEQRFGK